ncbi:MAG: GGDEF domain-containing protein [Halobacteriovoraceae bacterium]|nr:GGDEF domain-containing protein [Peredibacter sp.]MBJ00374.1 GGDEF domain-containing protein [Halobacteriovoraceae bacterium]|tara:strand:+ start:4044 stop:4952 length:909 start_codon:yes stop_codon:yes gene_type:complete
MSDDNATLVITDIDAALSASDKEAENRPACFLVVGGELNGTIFDLNDGETIVGRNPDCAIPLDFNGVSRKHFKVIINAGSSTLQDLGSSNGTYLNNSKIEGAVELSKGDTVKLGSIALKYLPKGDTERLTYDKLQREANTDGLTGCYNKTYFNNKLDLEVKKSKLTGSPLSLIIFDLDHFKHLNDNYGHDAGDYVLKEKAQLLRDNGIRKQDVFARYGGEEFVVLLPNTNLKQAFEIAERLRKLVESHEFIYDGQRLPVTASIGVADYRQGVNTGTDLFKRADSAVYKSKEGGRNQVNFFKS